MALIDWSDSYSVKIKEIDNQHAKLVGIINELHTAMKEGKGKETIGKVLDELINYTEVHFKFEESLMGKNNYPELYPHKIQHVELVRQVMEFKKNLIAGNVVLSQEVQSFLKKWLVDHIIGTDKKYTPFLNSKGIS